MAAGRGGGVSHELDKMIRPVSARSAIGVIGELLVPFAARGPIVRRPRVTGWLERFDADRRAVAWLEELRARQGAGRIVLRTPGRVLAIILPPADADTVLDGSPEPFATANREKRAALARFQPHGSLISREPGHRATELQRARP